MITNEGKRICDHEFRNRTGLWCGCRRPAIVKVVSKIVPHMELDYCARHAPQIEPVLETVMTKTEQCRHDWRAWKNGGTLKDAARFARSQGVATFEFKRALLDKDKMGIVALALRRGYGERVFRRMLSTEK